MKHRHIAAYLRLTTFGALLATCASCSDFLEQDNRSGRDSETYFSTAEGVASLEATMLDGMKATALNTEMEEWGADLYIPTRKTGDIPVNSYSLTADNGDIKSYYAGVYKLVNNANCMLKYAANGGDKAELYQAEALFVRSYGYYKLVQHFGAVPYVEAYIESASRNYPRMPLSELYPKLEADLQAALQGPLPDEDRNGLVSKQAVNALLAKVCLEAGWDLGANANANDGNVNADNNEWFQKAKAYADAAIGGKQLTMPFADKWSYKNQHNEEVIFALQYLRDGYPGQEQEGGHDLMFQYSGYFVGSKTEGIKYGNSMMCPSLKGIYLWEKGDERYEATFMTTIYNSLKSKLPWADGSIPDYGYFAYYNDKADKATLPIAVKFYPWWMSKTKIKKEFSDNPTVWEDHAGDTDEATKTANKTQAVLQGATVTKWTFNDKGAPAKADGEALTYSEQNLGTQNNQPVRKWDDPLAMCLDGDNKTDYREVPILHLSDLYLTRAEALLMMGDQAGAEADINAVRKRAGLDPTSCADYAPEYANAAHEVAANSQTITIRPIDLVLDEKARECWAERNRWTDCRRTRQLQRYNAFFNVYCSKAVKTYHPIPAGEIVSNEGMTDADQNPGY